MVGYFLLSHKLGPLVQYHSCLLENSKSFCFHPVFGVTWAATCCPCWFNYIFICNFFQLLFILLVLYGFAIFCFDNILICFKLPFILIFFPKHVDLWLFLLFLLCFKWSICFIAFICIALTFHDLFVSAAAAASGLLVFFSYLSTRKPNPSEDQYSNTKSFLIGIYFSIPQSPKWVVNSQNVESKLASFLKKRSVIWELCVFLSKDHIWATFLGLI